MGVQKKNFPLAPLANLVLYPHLKIRGAAHANVTYDSLQLPVELLQAYWKIFYARVFRNLPLGTQEI